MGTRRIAREQALQALFYMDMHQDPESDPVALFRSCFARDTPAEPFFHCLVDGVQSLQEFQYVIKYLPARVHNHDWKTPVNHRDRSMSEIRGRVWFRYHVCQFLELQGPLESRGVIVAAPNDHTLVHIAITLSDAGDFCVQGQDIMDPTRHPL